MGQSIFLGFCNKVTLPKRHLVFDQDQYIHQAFENHFGKNLYHCNDQKDYYQWTVDPDLLKDCDAIADFIQLQYERADQDPSYYKATLATIRSIKSASITSPATCL